MLYCRSCDFLCCWTDSHVNTFHGSVYLIIFVYRVEEDRSIVRGGCMRGRRSRVVTRTIRKQSEVKSCSLGIATELHQSKSFLSKFLCSRLCLFFILFYLFVFFLFYFLSPYCDDLERCLQMNTLHYSWYPLLTCVDGPPPSWLWLIHGACTK